MKRIAIILILLLCCATAQAEEGAPKRVTASFYPLYIATINVARDVPGLDIACLAPPAAGCLHDYSLTTADRRLLADSDFLILNGAGLESFLDKVLPGLDAPYMEAAQNVPLIEDEHGHGGANPHVWVSVDGMIEEVRAIALGLAGFDPEHVGQYAENAQAYIDELEALRDEMREALAPLADEPIVTFHEAFDYFARDFGLVIAATVQHEHDMAPSAREMAETADIIQREGVRALFAEPQYDDASVDILARETGVPVYLLDPAVSGEVDPADYGAYLRTMRGNTQTLLEALR